MAGLAKGYTGAAGATRSAKTTVWCRECGAFFGGDYLVTLNADTDPGALDRLLDEGIAGICTMRCPDCGCEHTPVESLVVHQPSTGSLYLVVPDGLRHRAQQLRAALIVDVGENPDGITPAYALNPTLVAGSLGLVELLTAPASEQPALQPDLEVEAPAAEAAAEAPKAVVKAAAEAEAPIAEPAVEAEPPVEVEAPAVEEPVSEAPANVEAAEPFELDSVELVSVEELLSEIPGESIPAVDSLSDAVTPSPEAPWDKALDAGWRMDAAPAPAEDPTQVARAEDIGIRRPAGPIFNVAMAGETDGYLEVDGEAARAVMRLAPERAAAFEEGPISFRVQVHTVDRVPVVLLTVALLGTDGGPIDHLFWLVAHETPTGRQMLDALTRVCAIDCVFHDAESGVFHGRRVARAPLEENVETARALVIAAKVGPDDLRDARLKVTAEGYDRLGQLKHNFREDSFRTLVTASDAKLALGIVSYWSAPERRTYLIQIKAFPQRWWDTVVGRVLSAGVDFGLAMEPHMRQLAVAAGKAAHATALLQLQLANFAEVNLNLKPRGGLDALDIWENWESLLALAEDLEMRVDEDIEELASGALERARDAAQANMEPIEIAEDDLLIEEVSELGGISESDLVELLETPNRRVEAALGLLSKGEAVFAPVVFDAIRRMARDEMVRVVPAALTLGPAFEIGFLGGLSSRRLTLQIASALFLSEIRSERGAGPILRLLPMAGEQEWRILARAVARLGRRILAPALAVATLHPERADRLGFTLALLGAEARGALAAARDEAANPGAIACLEIALEGSRDIGFGDAADFTERLADALSGLGPDLVGPDFEEDLESIDFGPGASYHDLDAIE